MFLSSAFLLWALWTLLTKVSFIQSHTHYLSTLSNIHTCSYIPLQFRFRYLAQGYINMQTGRTKDQTTDLSLATWPILPEQQRHAISQLYDSLNSSRSHHAFHTFVTLKHYHSAARGWGTSLDVTAAPRGVGTRVGWTFERKRWNWDGESRGSCRKKRWIKAFP